ncbi:MAG: flavodoxin family protein [Desulfovermiculus sp.]|nr:flavodoxin family protein [Desulfovermiculus sp.]
MHALNISFSSTGNTRKVANTIVAAMQESGLSIDDIPAKDAVNIDLLNYDLIFLGSGVYEWLPGKPMQQALADLRKKYVQIEEIKPASPKRPGKKAVVYCTYGGVHTGINEAIPAVKYMAQIFDHLGIEVVGEWYVVGEYHGSLQEHSQNGRLGDIRGRPDERDLKEVAEMVRGVLRV